jgi:hypothetical protein
MRRKIEKSPLWVGTVFCGFSTLKEFVMSYGKSAGDLHNRTQTNHFMYKLRCFEKESKIEPHNFELKE